MARAQKVQDGNYAERMQDALLHHVVDVDLGGIIEDDDGPAEVNSAETYAEALILMGNPGLVLYMSDGAEVHLTITAYVPREG